MLVVEDLHVHVGDREILRGVDLVIDEGETHVLLGPNGGGKTTLLNTIVGLPGYQVTQGRILFKGVDLAGLDIDERARMGIGVAFQRPPAVRGIKLRQLIEVAADGRFDEAMLADLVGELALENMIDRDVNMGFSGGEMKRSEMAQLLAQAPDLTLFDEPESGVDLDNIAVVGTAMTRLLKAERAGMSKRAGLIVTHTGHILEYVNADIGHVLYGGRLACRGNPRDLIGEIGRHGYDKCVECAICQR
ncbi:ABC transporter ATP-binding protein [Coriobacteriia bacterium Es71-Z0120]|uniref:ABC transporter ATP-binding protein n=1 Tax=Parvivirga hydrogeniphila TaxID=2939460 RepID=UPI002260E92D|nr:ABC transporter ATP-binding protein [Parvivirga hydrogeniphila]